jgi:hypothetical protein
MPTSDGAKRRPVIRYGSQIPVRVFHWTLIHSLLVSRRRWRCNRTPDIVNCCWLAPVVFPSLVEGVFHVKSRISCGFAYRCLFAIVYNTFQSMTQQQQAQHYSCIRGLCESKQSASRPEVGGLQRRKRWPCLPSRMPAAAASPGQCHG